MATAKFSLFKKRKRRPSRSAETWPVTPTTTISGRTSLKKKKKKENAATPEYRQRILLFTRTQGAGYGDAFCRVLGEESWLWKRESKPGAEGGGRGGGLIRSALTTGIRGLEKKRGKNEADVAEKGRPDVFNGGWYVRYLCTLLSLKNGRCLCMLFFASRYLRLCFVIIIRMIKHGFGLFLSRWFMKYRIYIIRVLQEYWLILRNLWERERERERERWGNKKTRKGWLIVRGISFTRV